MAASHPDLKITKRLERVAVPGEVWALWSQTQEGETAFLEAVIAAPRSVVIFTWESENRAELVEDFEAVLRSARVVPFAGELQRGEGPDWQKCSGTP